MIWKFVLMFLASVLFVSFVGIAIVAVFGPVSAI